MLVGHFAIALAGKRAAPAVSLGTLTLASMLPDLLGFVFIMSGLEHWRMIPGGRGVDSAELYDIPLSHSLLMDVIWGLLLRRSIDGDVATQLARRSYSSRSSATGCSISSATSRICRSRPA